MSEDTNFIQSEGTRFAEAYNNKIAEAIIEQIDNLINLKDIITNDNATRKKAFDEAYEACNEESLREKLFYEEIKFPTIKDKMQYAFGALLEKGYTFTHDVNPAGVVSIKFFSLVKECKYELNGSYSVNIKEI